MQPPAGSPGPGRTVLSKGRSKKTKAEFCARRCGRQPLRPNRSDPGPVVPGAGEADSSNRPCRWRKLQNRGALARRAAVDVWSANRLPFLDSVLPARAMENFVKDLCPCPLAARGSHDEADAAPLLRPPAAHGSTTPGFGTEEPARGLAGRNATAARLAQLPADALHQTGVAGQAEQAVDIVVVAPRPVAARRLRERRSPANAGVRRCAPVPPRSRAATANTPRRRVMQIGQ